MRLALFQPDIPQNTGALMRIGACFGVPLDIIEPCGFPLDDRRLRRTAMDYNAAVVMERHASWEAFLTALEGRDGRLVLLTTAASVNHTEFSYAANDTLLLGRESAGVPDYVVARAEGRVRIPMAVGLRSLNVAAAGGIVLAEALRQTGAFTGKLRL